MRARRLAAVIVAGMLAFGGAAACGDDDVDEAQEQIEETGEDAGEAIEEGAEDAQDEIEGATDEDEE
jgi:hypothetical protein